MADIHKAFSVAGEIGRMDIGQGAVVCEGLVLAVEAQEGTDAMLARCAGLPVELRGQREARRASSQNGPSRSKNSASTCRPSGSRPSKAPPAPVSAAWWGKRARCWCWTARA